MAKQNPYLYRPEREQITAYEADGVPLAGPHLVRLSFAVPPAARIVLVPFDWARLHEYGTVEYSLDDTSGPWIDIEGAGRIIEAPLNGNLEGFLRATPSQTAIDAGHWPSISIAPVNLDGPDWQKSLAELPSIETAVQVNHVVERAAYFYYFNGELRWHRTPKERTTHHQQVPDRHGNVVSYEDNATEHRIQAHYSGPLGKWTTLVSRRNLMPRSWPVARQTVSVSRDSMS